jgi:enamine deaminase RidA (YjgF/YER057c/UK114 family)
MRHKRISLGTKWESRVGYSRAVQAGSEVHISGTTATDSDGGVVGKNNPYEQTKQALQNIKRALQATDASFDDVVRTRMFVTDIDDWEAIGDAHSKFFTDVRPATSMVEGPVSSTLSYWSRSRLSQPSPTESSM